MKKFIQTIFVAGLTLAIAPHSFAQGRRGGTTYTPGTSAYGSSIAYGYVNEIITGGTTGYLVSQKACTNCKSTTAIMLSGAYLRTFTPNIQAGAQVTMDNNGTDSLFTLLALGVYNFETDFKNAFFAKGGIGLFPVPNSTLTGYENKFGFMIGGGKRFPLWDRVNYIPSISMFKKGDLDIGFEIQFFNFSFMF